MLKGTAGRLYSSILLPCMPDITKFDLNLTTGRCRFQMDRQHSHCEIGGQMSWGEGAGKRGTGLLVMGAVCAWLLLMSGVVRASLPDAVSGDQVQQQEQYWPEFYHPRYPHQLHDIYQQRERAPLWFSAEQAFEARQELRWQLLELALAGAPSQFGIWLREIGAAGEISEHSDAIYTDAYIGIATLRQNLISLGYQQAMSLESLATVPLSVISTGIAEELIVARSSTLLHNLLSYQGDSEQSRLNRRNILRLLELDASLPQWPQLDTGPLLRPGTRSARVPVMREQLQLLGYSEVVAKESGGDMLDTSLAAVVEQFQRQHGLKVDGIIGPQTRHWLNATPLVRARLLARNQFRLQLFHLHQMGQQLVVNLPAFEMGLYRQGELQLQSRVIVGRSSRPTPLLQSKISSVVLNPAWNVPRSILRKDILPKLRHDPDYLLRQRFNLIRYDGQPVNYAGSDWQELLYQPGIPFRLQQRPGEGNALGRYKFHFDNDFAVYLHDTSSPRLFSEAERSFSSGCIRVEQSAQLADYLFRQAGYSDKYTSFLLNDGKTHWLPLHHTVPIFTVYWTAWVDPRGQPQYRNDIYHLDTSVWAQPLPLAATLLSFFRQNKEMTYISES